MTTSRTEELRALDDELRRQERELETLRAFAEANPAELRLGDEIRERMGALVERTQRRVLAPAPVRGIAI